MRKLKSVTVLAVLAAATTVLASPPAYTIVDLGILDPGDFGSQGYRVSPNGQYATGRTLGVSNQAFLWTNGGGTAGLPNLATHPYGAGNAVNNSGVVVGTGAATFFGSDPRPIMWENGVATQLPLPAGYTFGRANGVNNANVAVGSVGSSIDEVGVIYSNGAGSVITTPTANGSTIRTAYSINDAGLVVGFGVDPNNAARNVGFVYDSVNGTSFEVGLLPGRNGAIAFGVSEAGHVAGSSSQNQGSGVPFVWTESTGTVEIPLPTGTTQGSARGVNSDGWVVGTASSAFAIPFLYDGDATYRIQDLLPAGTDWDLSTNTSSSALGISDNGVIVGTGIHNGDTRAYAMIPVPEPTSIALLALAAPALMRRRRR